MNSKAPNQLFTLKIAAMIDKIIGGKSDEEAVSYFIGKPQTKLRKYVRTKHSLEDLKQWKNGNVYAKT